jgi:uncharacterized membrane protein
LDQLALAFIVVAAVLHAAWNILLKTAADPLRTATAGVVAASAVLVPVVVVAWLAVGRPSVPPEAWLLGIASGGVEVLYFVFLAAAFRRGDLSVVYPLARGSAPVLAVAVGVVVLGERLAPPAALGVALLVAGLLVVQRPWRLIGSSGARARAGAGFAILTGATIAIYSSLDKVGVQQTPPWLYAGILWPACGIGLAAVAWIRPRLRGGRYRAADEALEPWRVIGGGLLTFSAYFFVLAALSRAPLAIVAPLRESAIILTSAWGIVRLREAVEGREIAFRLAGSICVLAGAAMLAVGR